MKHLFLFLFCTTVISLKAQDNLTVFEKSDGKETPTYNEIINYYQNLAVSSEYIDVKEMGMTDSGFPLHLVTLDVDKGFDFKQSYAKGKTIVLINNGIHPGEPDGIDASMMLLRDFVESDEKRATLNDVVVAVIPVYNIGGALNRNSHSRANQNGPLEYGFRGNARNYDLNRDFIKCDTKNARSFAEIFHFVNPDIFIDTHVSNGADYQYAITHLATQHSKMGGPMGKYIEEEFTPQLEAIIKSKGSEITPYVNVFNTPPDKEGFTQFLDNPRYSTGYTTLFHALGFMIETHMLKPFDIRVKATYNFLETVLELATTDGKKIRELKEQQQTLKQAGEKHGLSWRLDRSKHKTITFKGFEGETIKSKVTGQDRLIYGHNRPYTKQIPYFNNFAPIREVIIPKAYIIPQGRSDIMSLMDLNKVTSIPLRKDTTIQVEAYRIEKFNTSSSPYEGHYPHNNVSLTSSKQSMTFKAGDYLISTNQKAWRYLVETLEPQATDSFFNWNFFDTSLQKKEGFSPYVFEDVAWQILQRDADLRREFEAKKKISSEFANNWYAQLDFIYKRSEYYEKVHMNYPVYRVMD